MTYNVFSGTLHLTQPTNLKSGVGSKPQPPVKLATGLLSITDLMLCTRIAVCLKPFFSATVLCGYLSDVSVHLFVRYLLTRCCQDSAVQYSILRFR